MNARIAQRLRIDEPALRAFCVRWQIVEFAVFGSILRDDFTRKSDIDVLVTFKPDHQWSVLDHLRMEAELREIVGRDVQIVSTRAIGENANWLTRQTIAETAQRIYAA